LVAEGFTDPVAVLVSSGKDFGTVLVGPTQPFPSQLASKPVKGSGTDDPFVQMAFVELAIDPPIKQSSAPSLLVPVVSLMRCWVLGSTATTVVVTAGVADFL